MEDCSIFSGDETTPNRPEQWWAKISNTHMESQGHVGRQKPWALGTPFLLFYTLLPPYVRFREGRIGTILSVK